MPTLRVLQTNLCAVLCAVVASLLLTAAGFNVARAAETQNSETAITGADIDNAASKVKEDPNLAQERQIKTLRWRGDSQEAKAKRQPSWLKWIGDFFGFLAQTSRVIVWLAIAVAVALLVVAIVKIVRNIAPSSRATPFNAPTHVRDLDIRPESLPDDIGAAALALWERSEHRAALALLYRGVLSRLVHGHEIPIRHSSTEGDCLLLAMQRLQGERGVYVARVIGVWQRAVYGAQHPQSADVQIICAGFGAALGNSSAPSRVS